MPRYVADVSRSTNDLLRCGSMSTAPGLGAWGSQARYRLAVRVRTSSRAPAGSPRWGSGLVDGIESVRVKVTPRAVQPVAHRITLVRFARAG